MLSIYSVVVHQSFIFSIHIKIVLCSENIIKYNHYIALGALRQKLVVICCNNTMKRSFQPERTLYYGNLSIFIHNFKIFSCKERSSSCRNVTSAMFSQISCSISKVQAHSRSAATSLKTCNYFCERKI